MKPNTTHKLVIDATMTLMLLFLMGYHLWGRILHEWVGTGMLLLFILHHILNSHWHKKILKGPYTSQRLLMLIVDSLVLVSMLFQMYSGVVLSRYVFDGLPFHHEIALARRLHILGAYWGFLSMSLHLGLHWNMILAMFHKTTGIKIKIKGRRINALIISLYVAGYGVWALIDRDFTTYLFLKSEFVFLNYNESKIIFYADYLSIMWLCVFFAYCITKLIRKYTKKSEESQ